MSESKLCMRDLLIKRLLENKDYPSRAETAADGIAKTLIHTALSHSDGHIDAIREIFDRIDGPAKCGRENSRSGSDYLSAFYRHAGVPE